ncbi:class I SAM-dependent methyltransferase [Patulibacter defluvii]|uniref:class I SAM-dependent methyltransferase n=1 Tax=Patulibacter defluvii TaxID=3095358 RepID=UPI002A75F4B8|nr:class I SAM-dependent methyltransferase [Patulibacter sp. DM4]
MSATLADDPIWTSFAASYDDLVPRLDCFWRMAAKAVDHVAGRATVVDAGCGTGLLLPELLRHGARRVVGFDPNPAMRARAERRRAALAPGDRVRVTLLDGRAERFPDAVPATVDAILLVNVLFNVGDPEAVFAACRERLAPGGRLVVTGPRQAPDLDGLIERSLVEWKEQGRDDDEHRAAIDRHLDAARRIVAEPGHVRRLFAPDELAELLREQGFARVVAADGDDYFGQNFHVCVER